MLQCRTVNAEGLSPHQECGFGPWRCVLVETIQNTFRRGRSPDGGGYVFDCPHTVDLSSGPWDPSRGESGAASRPGMVFPPPLIFVRVARPPRFRPALPPRETTVLAGVVALLTFAWLHRARTLAARGPRRPDADTTAYRRNSSEGVDDLRDDLERDVRRTHAVVAGGAVVLAVASAVAIVGR